MDAITENAIKDLFTLRPVVFPPSLITTHMVWSHKFPLLKYVLHSLRMSCSVFCSSFFSSSSFMYHVLYLNFCSYVFVYFFSPLIFTASFDVDVGTTDDGRHRVIGRVLQRRRGPGGVRLGTRRWDECVECVCLLRSGLFDLETFFSPVFSSILSLFIF